MFKDKINNLLNEFVKQWQRHPLSSEHNFSPLQLFMKGVLENLNSNYSGIDSFLHEEELQVYGVDYNSEMNVRDRDYQVTVPRIDMDLSNEHINLTNADKVFSFFINFPMTQVVFHINESEISPFLAIIVL